MTWGMFVLTKQGGLGFLLHVLFRIAAHAAQTALSRMAGKLRRGLL
jgi:hypothetical protein